MGRRDLSPEERAFHARIARNRADTQSLLVLADWLQDRDDPRADGYRVMGELGLSPYPSRRDVFHVDRKLVKVENGKSWFSLEHLDGYYDWSFSFYGNTEVTDPQSDVPVSVLRAMTGGHAPDYDLHDTYGGHPYEIRVFATYREALDGFARAWATLAPDDRAAARARIANYRENRTEEVVADTDEEEADDE